MISEQTRKTWRIKLNTIFDAIEIKAISLYAGEFDFLLNVERVLDRRKDISLSQSKWLNRIYERVE